MTTIPLDKHLNSAAPTGFVRLVGAGPGAADLLTVRALRAIETAEVIVADALVSPEVLALAPASARIVDVGKRKGAHSASQDRINEILVAEARAGHDVVRLKSGDPLVFGRAGEEIAALRDAGIAFEIVPGITAAFAAAAIAEIPLTLRGTSSSIVFATGHDMRGDTLPDWAGLTLTGATVAVYMGKTVAGRIAGRLIDAGLSPATPVAVIANASRSDQEILGGELADLHRLSDRADLDGPALILIGEVAALGAGAAIEALSTHLARAA